MILARGALELRFSKSGLAFIALGILPFCAEATVSACLGYALYDMSWLLSFVLGFLLANAGTASIVPYVYVLRARG